MKKILALLAVLGTCAPALGEEAKSFDAAAAFGARPSASGMTLSPDGKSVAYRRPIEGQGSALFTVTLADSKSRPTLAVNGKPERLGRCSWVANDRLACHIYANMKDPVAGVVTFDRLVAVNADSTNVRLLSKEDTGHNYGISGYGGSIIDPLPSEDGAVLMARPYVPEVRK